MTRLSLREAQVLMLLSATPQSRQQIQQTFERRYGEAVSPSRLGNLLGILRNLELIRSETLIGTALAYALTDLGEHTLEEAFVIVTGGAPKTPGADARKSA